MKKTLIALAALGVVGAASAQVAITGGVAYGIQNKIGASTAKFHMTNADIYFSASEDLGGGLSVAAATGISMEGGYGNTSTTENTSLSMTGGFGNVTFKNVLSGNAKMGEPSVEDNLSDVLGGYSKVNVFSYTTPELIPGLTASAEWVGAQTSDLAASGTPTLLGNYKSGPVTVYVDNGGSSKVWDLRITYDMGSAKLAVRSDKEKFQEFNVTVPMGAMSYGVYMASKGSTAKASGFSAAYALSKRTSVTFGYVSSSISSNFTGKAVADTSGGNNYRLNLAHSF